MSAFRATQTGWTNLSEAADSARYRALGNSVAILCGAFVLRGVVYFLRNCCTIERIITLPGQEYKDFRAHPTTPRTFIAENTDCMYEDSTDTHHCLLVLGDASSNGIAVEIIRRSYDRYMVLIPGAREFVHARLNTFANLILTEYC